MGGLDQCSGRSVGDTTQIRSGRCSAVLIVSLVVEVAACRKDDDLGMSTGRCWVASCVRLKMTGYRPVARSLTHSPTRVLLKLLIVIYLGCSRGRSSQCPASKSSFWWRAASTLPRKSGSGRGGSDLLPLASIRSHSYNHSDVLRVARLHRDMGSHGLSTGVGVSECRLKRSCYRRIHRPRRAKAHVRSLTGM